MSTSSAAFESFGIIGYGHFGRFVAPSLARCGEVRVYDADAAKLEGMGDGVTATTLEEAAHCDVVVVAVPAAAFESVLARLRGALAEDTVVMDVLSTKAEATRQLRSVLSGHPNLLATHPLFGPPSMEGLAPGQRMVVTYSSGPRARELEVFLGDTFGLDLVHVDPDQHDRAMAYMQALPFFIARALDQMDIDQFDSALEIPSFHKLAEIARIERHHSPEMFETSQLSNPYAREVREAFIEIIEELDRKLS